MPPPDPDPIFDTPGVLRGWPLPVPGAGKEQRGRVLVVGGSAETPGAALLSALAALRTGAGKLQIATVRSTAPYLAVDVPAGLVRGLPETDGGAIDPAGAEKLIDLAGRAKAVLIGPGLTGAGKAAELWATYVHGRAGDRLAARIGRLGVLARELSAEIPTVLTELEG